MKITNNKLNLVICALHVFSGEFYYINYNSNFVITSMLDLVYLNVINSNFIN